MNTETYLAGLETLRPQELVYGVVRDAPAPTPLHQWALGEIFGCFRAHLGESGAGRAWMAPIDVVLDRDSSCSPT